ncbi:4-coumarate--CoA ligase-like [Ostrinia furnacalis]|uniref:4-coumarate--CoA ligase-like n=1 Tax=Ostrinia furnacalis TaxID=93504 RepID=UPI00103DBBC7|nr:4-coumarate--CoA ligase-like [Ostrinia furnacalis]
MSRNSRLFRHFSYVKWHRNLSSNVRKVDDFTVTSSLPFQPVPRMRLFDRMWVHASQFKDQVALVSAETKKSYTYSQLHRFIANFGTSLLKRLHLRPGDIVAIVVPNCPEYPVAAFGALQAGCVVTTVNPAYRNYELVHQFTITKPNLVVTVTQAYPFISKALDAAKIDAKVVIIDNPTQSIPDGTIRYSEIAESGEADYSVLDKIEKDHDDVALIPFSSGTTGLPKGVEITYKNLISSFDIMTHKEFVLPEIANGTDQEIVPCVLPFFHIFGLVITLMGHLSVGAKLITMSSFDPATYITVLTHEKATLLYVVPPLVDFLAKYPLVNKSHFEHVKYIFSGGAALSGGSAEAVLQKANEKTQFRQGYATTETTCMGTATPKNGGRHYNNSCGDPALNIELRMCDADTGTPVPIGQVGEVCFRSPIIAKGYYQNEQATKDSMTSDGFYKTGDLGVYKPGEGLYIVDRIKEIIKVKGMQVSPAELENILRTHPLVHDVGVIGVPDKLLGEAPKAYVVVRKPTTAEELKKFVADQVVAYKKIKDVVFVDAIPKNATGKVLKKDLKNL